MPTQPIRRSRQTSAAANASAGLLLALAVHLGLQAGTVMGGAERLPHTHVVLGGNQAAQTAALEHHLADQVAGSVAPATVPESSAPLTAPDTRVVSVPSSATSLLLLHSDGSGLMPSSDAWLDLAPAGRIGTPATAHHVGIAPSVRPPPPRSRG